MKSFVLPLLFTLGSGFNDPVAALLPPSRPVRSHSSQRVNRKNARRRWAAGDRFAFIR